MRSVTAPALCPGVLQVVVKQVPHRHDLLTHTATAGAGTAAPPPEPAAADTEVERLRAEVQRMRVAEQRANEERDAALARQMHETELRRRVCVRVCSLVGTAKDIHCCIISSGFATARPCDKTATNIRMNAKVNACLW